MLPGPPAPQRACTWTEPQLPAWCKLSCAANTAGSAIRPESELLLAQPAPQKPPTAPPLSRTGHEPIGVPACPKARPANHWPLAKTQAARHSSSTQPGVFSSLVSSIEPRPWLSKTLLSAQSCRPTAGTMRRPLRRFNQALPQTEKSRYGVPMRLILSFVTRRFFVILALFHHRRHPMIIQASRN